MKSDATAALFVMLGQTAERCVRALPDIPPSDELLISPSYNLAVLLPDKVRRASVAAETYKLFFVFEGYLRELVVEVLSREVQVNWWTKIPKDVQDEVVKLEETEEAKTWMALGARDKSALMTYPQLLRVIDHNWKGDFEEVIRDKALVQEARTISHLRNTICHMSEISDEENERVKQVMRDWFRIVAP